MSEDHETQRRGSSEAGPSDHRDNDHKRKSRQPQLSCAECRRLKLKCDREIPCSNCVRRKCSDLCPNGMKETRRQIFDVKTAESLTKRLATLEGLLAEQGIDVPDPGPAARSPNTASPLGDQRDSKRRRESSASADGGQQAGGARRSSHISGKTSSAYPPSSGTAAGTSHTQTYPSPRYRDIRPGPSHSISPSISHARSAPTSSARDYDYPSALPPPLLVPGSRPSPSNQDNTYWTPNAPASTSAAEPRQVSSAGGQYIQQPRPDLPSENSDPQHGSSPMIMGDSGRSRSPVQHSHGTLVIGHSGRSRYLGPTAGTEWLKNQEMRNGDQTPMDESPSPELAPRKALATESRAERDKRQAKEHLLAFPFPLPAGASTVEQLLSHLPSRDDAEILMDSYYRYFAWNHDTAPRRFFQPVFDKIYDSVASRSYRNVHPQQLALLFVILAMGTLQNLELPLHDPSANEYLAYAKGCLTKGDFMNNNTIAGVQTLIIMAHYLLETEKGRDGDSAWPLWGLAMRIIVAMGLHRDGARWNLPAEVVEERRQVFWAAYAIEILQANCFSRPTSLAPQYIDTAFPDGPSDHPDGSKSYQTLRFELIQLSARILDTGMSVQFESYDTILSLYTRLCEFERSIPYELRCRTALLALPSEYPDPEVAKEHSPELNRRNLKRTFQQFTLALNISEHVLFLHRPYFVMAMHDQPMDPTRSVYGRSYLAVVERCSVMIQIVSALYEAHPAVSSRQWFLWYHIFTAAVCLGTMVLRNPTSVLAQFAITSIDTSIAVYSALIKQNNSHSPSMVQNHDWLIRLRQRAFNKVIEHTQSQSQARSQRRPKARSKRRRMHGDRTEGGAERGPDENEIEREHVSGNDSESGGSTSGEETHHVIGEEDLDIVGWRTRLIESAANGSQIAVNISASATNKLDRQYSEGRAPYGRADSNGHPHQDQGSGHETNHHHDQYRNQHAHHGPFDYSYHPHQQQHHQEPVPYLPAPTMMNNSGVVPAVQQVLQQHLVGLSPQRGSAYDLSGAGNGNNIEGLVGPNVGLNPNANASGGFGGNNNLGTDSSTDFLLHQFWDPMMMPDAGNLASANWWSWDLGMNNNDPHGTHSQAPISTAAQTQAQGQTHHHAQTHLQQARGTQPDLTR
ncbi:hypothetical protein IAU59_004659 [Kwoniella sp. CBS 9459]